MLFDGCHRPSSGGSRIGFVLFFPGIFQLPLGKQTDREPSEHTQNPCGILRPNPAFIFQAGDIEAQMKPVFNAPALAVDLKPLVGTQPFGRTTGNQEDGLAFARS